MTVTEERADGAAAEAAPATPATPGGLPAVLTTVDHRVIGRCYVVAALVFLLVAGVAGGLLGVERVDTGGLDVLEDDTFTQVFDLHRVSAVLLFLAPMWLGIATVVVPRQLGAPSIAFPRAAAAAMWGWLVSGGVLLASYVIDGGPDGGDAEAVDLWLLSLGALVAALLIGTVCVVTTVLTMRTRGMALRHAPPFSWAALAGGTMVLLSFPLLLADLLVFYLDHHYGQVLLRDAAELLPGLDWFFGQPQVYVLAVPALGVVAEIVPVMVRARPARHEAVVGAVAAVALLGFGAFAQPGLSPDVDEEALFVALGIAVVLPALALTGLMGDTVRRGRLRLDAPLLFAVGALLTFLLAAAAGAAGVIEPFELRGTTWESGQVHLVLLGAGGLGVFGALHYWAPQLWGRRLAEGPGRLQAAVMLLGVLLLAAPDLVSGALDQPVGATRFDGNDVVEPLNGLALVGAGLVLLGVLVFVVNLLRTLGSRSAEAVTDPWDGHTLEWADEPPAEITSERPLLDQREQREQPEQTEQRGQEAVTT